MDFNIFFTFNDSYAFISNGHLTTIHEFKFLKLIFIS
jgi:hypothetical protein